jgi:ribosome-binding factor A
LSVRTEKVAEEIKHQIAGVLSRDLAEPDLGLVTVTRVVISADLKLAKIYLSFLGNRQSVTDCIEKINFRKGNIKMHLGSKLRLKYTPEIYFYHDDTSEYADKIERIIKTFRKANDEEDSQ